MTPKVRNGVHGLFVSASSSEGRTASASRFVPEVFVSAALTLGTRHNGNRFVAGVEARGYLSTSLDMPELLREQQSPRAKPIDRNALGVGRVLKRRLVAAEAQEQVPAAARSAGPDPERISAPAVHRSSAALPR